MLKKVIIGFSVLLLLVFVLFKLKSSFGFNDNSLNVEIDSKLDMEKVKIYKGYFPADELKIENINKSEKLLIFKGQQIQSIKTDYGENDFIFIYADKLYCRFRHFKTNNRQIDTYRFKLNKIDDELK